MRDWRSGIVTITVRDQRYREHDPILGVVPLRLSDILQTSSQVTRWYPLDGGIVSTGRDLFRSADAYIIRVSDVYDCHCCFEVWRQDYHLIC